jgi:hypothetical protein
MPSAARGIGEGLRRLSTTIAIVVCLGLVQAGLACGGKSQPDNFSKGYNTAIERLDRASRNVIALAPARKTRSSRAIARQLDRFADALARTREELSRLKPPDRAARQFHALVAALDRSVAEARRAARAARAIQPVRQRRALQQLRTAALEIAQAQDALARAVSGANG